MNQTSEPAEPSSQGSCSKTGLVVLVIILAVTAALVVKGILLVREQSRLMRCRNNLKQIGLALHNYHQANKIFPPGTTSAYKPIQPGNQYDIWSEAAESGPGFHGTSFIIRLFPYVGGDNPTKDWRYDQGISSRYKGEKEWASNFDMANLEIPGLYCPSRREGFRPQDRQMMLTPAWTGGGTDYGGCAGRHAAFTLATGYNLCDASTYYEPTFYPKWITADIDDDEKRWGVFGRVNVGTTMKEIRDGTSCTIMTGELQRILDITPGSVDGWIIGGPATLFTTGALFRCTEGRLECVASPKEGRLLNNKFFGSPGSAHVGGANFGLVDGHVTFIRNDVDPGIFALMGSMCDNKNPLDD